MVTEIETLRALANEATKKGAATTCVYVLAPSKQAPRHGTINRAGGPPIGVDGTSRPRSNSGYMQHLLTLDLATMPELRKKAKGLEKARAVALFITDARENNAFEPGNGETRVLLLSEEQVAMGQWSGVQVRDPKARSFTPFPIDIPKEIFSPDFDAFEDEDTPLSRLYLEMMSQIHVGGDGIFFDGDEYEGDGVFICQFNESLVDVNLGDAGTMYVFSDDAWWAGH